MTGEHGSGARGLLGNRSWWLFLGVVLGLEAPSLVRAVTEPVHTIWIGLGSDVSSVLGGVWVAEDGKLPGIGDWFHVGPGFVGEDEPRWDRLERGERVAGTGKVTILDGAPGSSNPACSFASYTLTVTDDGTRVLTVAWDPSVFERFEARAEAHDRARDDDDVLGLRDLATGEQVRFRRMPGDRYDHGLLYETRVMTW